MTKPNKLFSWLGLGKKSEPEVVTPTQESTPDQTPAQTMPTEVSAEAQPSLAVAVEPQSTVAASEVELAESTVAVSPEPAAPAQAAIVATSNESAAEKKPGFFARLKQGLAKTSQNLGNGLASLFLGKKIDDDLYEELENAIIDG